MKIVLIGPPGSGKGTQAKLISSSLSIPVILISDLIRREIEIDTEESKKLKEIISAGHLVDDATVFALLMKRLKFNGNYSNFILDGYPRTIIQAEKLQQIGINIDYVIYFRIDDEMIINRLSKRRIHQESGRVYHLESKPPKVPNRDDITGEILCMRKDDNPEILKERLIVYKKETEPLIAYYQRLIVGGSNIKLVNIDASQTIDNVANEILLLFSIENTNLE